MDIRYPQLRIDQLLQELARYEDHDWADQLHHHVNTIKHQYPEEAIRILEAMLK